MRGAQARATLSRPLSASLSIFASPPARLVGSLSRSLADLTHRRRALFSAARLAHAGGGGESGQEEGARPVVSARSAGRDKLDCAAGRLAGETAAGQLAGLLPLARALLRNAISPDCTQLLEGRRWESRAGRARSQFGPIDSSNWRRRANCPAGPGHARPASPGPSGPAGVRTGAHSARPLGDRNRRPQQAAARDGSRGFALECARSPAELIKFQPRRANERAGPGLFLPAGRPAGLPALIIK